MQVEMPLLLFSVKLHPVYWLHSSHLADLEGFNMQQVYHGVLDLWIQFSSRLSGAGFPPADSPPGGSLEKWNFFYPLPSNWDYTAAEILAFD